MVWIDYFDVFFGDCSSSSNRLDAMATICVSAQSTWLEFHPSKNPILFGIRNTGVFQAWPFIYGTLITSIFAIILAVPISLGYLHFSCRILPGKNTLATELDDRTASGYSKRSVWLVGNLRLPSQCGSFQLAKALFAAFGQIPVLNFFFTGPIPQSGASRLAAAMILTIMIIPTITAITRDVLAGNPEHST